MKARVLGLLAVKGNRVVKSIAYSQWRPGIPLNIGLMTLDRWGVDEILIIDISRRGQLDPAVIEIIQRVTLTTPLAYGGGIRSSSDVLKLQRAGVERFILEDLLQSSPVELREISNLVGSQALIASVPVTKGSGGRIIFSPNGQASEIDASELVNDLLENGLVSEVLISNVTTKGFNGSFPLELATAFSSGFGPRYIWMGGIDPNVSISLSRLEQTAAVVLGNSLFEQDFSLGPYHPTRRKSVSLD